MIIGKTIYLAYDGKEWGVLQYEGQCPGNSIVEVTISAGWAKWEREIVRRALESLACDGEFDELCEGGVEILSQENVIPFPERR